ncbi:MAG: 2-amino-4-hydroxy-6-hydroxymethyldihydropteridine diphosphokinase, partial [Promicromonosporaceae bacterium]|nr:2-amino-4-hydroxy-6-hydroxymethyldihydropteridine diphosphokinase [Promicromonosporaceae bacterium]
MTEQPVFGTDGLPLDHIKLRAIKATAMHGVLESERVEPQTFIADVSLYLDTRAAARDDDLAATVDYAAVAGAVTYVLTSPPVKLIETLAEQIAAAVLAFSGVHAVDVAVHKPSAALPMPFKDVYVSIRRDLATRPPSVPAPGLSELVAPQVVEPVGGVGLGVGPIGAASDVGVGSGSSALGLGTASGAPAVAASSSPMTMAEPEPLGNDVLDQVPSEPVRSVLALGSNLGNSKEILRSAVTALRNLPGVAVVDVGPLARTSPVGGPDGQNDYLNTVVAITTMLSPRQLLAGVNLIEDDFNRIRAEMWGPRTLDIDIITYGHLVESSADLTIPHHLAGERAFVLLPWSRMQPGAVLPGLGGGPVASLAQTAPDRGGIRWLALDWLTDPEPKPEVEPEAALEVEREVEREPESPAQALAVSNAASWRGETSPPISVGQESIEHGFVESEVAEPGEHHPGEAFGLEGGHAPDQQKVFAEHGTLIRDPLAPGAGLPPLHPLGGHGEVAGHGDVDGAGPHWAPP